jgi:hypothetical protein
MSKKSIKDAKLSIDQEIEYYECNPTAIFTPAPYMFGYGLLGAILITTSGIYGSIHANKAIAHAASHQLGHTWTTVLTSVTSIVIALVALFIGGYLGGKLGLTIGYRKRDAAAKAWFYSEDSTSAKEDSTPANERTSLLPKTQ